ncbi:RloB family protein [Phytohabitans suffuscus]|uniref:RloB-like protein n=1 Tax=Phytohabitans suffuscus TaxID=624315 RepID=A0A6F8YR12_9ACTN|nr:RloB family protein [Phytohabitans suffuscus]BCB88433.1 hypothetical protein Psuf_057460 [Phytohabitans suffuscus]
MPRRERGRESHQLRRLASKRRRDVWVYTEGELTEPQYVDLVKEMQPVRRNDVHIANDTRQAGGTRGSGGRAVDRKPADLVDAAIDHKRRLDRQAADAGVRAEFFPVVWCIFDRDDHAGVDAAIERARRGGVRVAFSHPCFELWRLLHQQDYSTPTSGVCDEVAGRLSFAQGVPRKQRKAVTIDQIEGRFADARKRARQLNAQHDDHMPYTARDPYTDVWEFVESLGVLAY